MKEEEEKEKEKTINTLTGPQKLITIGIHAVVNIMQELFTIQHNLGPCVRHAE